jgi:hypothetical protein
LELIMTADTRLRVRLGARAWVPIAAGAVGLGLLLGACGGPGPDLAARAYAQLTPGSREILYLRTTSRARYEHEGEVSVSSWWECGGAWRWNKRDLDDPSGWTDVAFGANGCLRQRAGRAIFADQRKHSTTCREDDVRWYVDQSRRGFLAGFRHAYEARRLEPSGDATFNGQPAHRYVVTNQNVREEYYLNAESGSPIGSKFILTSTGASGEQHTDTDVTLVEAIEHLPPTPENVAKLNGAGDP